MVTQSSSCSLARAPLHAPSRPHLPLLLLLLGQRLLGNLPLERLLQLEALAGLCIHLGGGRVLAWEVHGGGTSSGLGGAWTAACVQGRANVCLVGNLNISTRALIIGGESKATFGTMSHTWHPHEAFTNQEELMG